MNITLLSSLGILTILLLYMLFWRVRYLRHKQDLERKIKQGLPLPVELLSGPFRVLEKVGDSIIKVCPIGKNTQRVLSFNVPKRMHTRIDLGIVYNFSYSYIDHEIRFDSKAVHSENSDLEEVDMKRAGFPLQTRILRRLIF